MARNQRTVRGEASVTGVGLHTGASTTLTVTPAEANQGVVFVRSDMDGEPRVPVHVASLRQQQRRTTLVGDAEAEVHTVEHFLSCMHALGIDNATVRISGPECPGMDGSARPFLDMLDAAGIKEQDEPRQVIRLDSPVSVQTGPRCSLSALPTDGEFSVAYTLEYGHVYLDTQHFSARVNPESFRKQIAGARTFCLEEEAQALRDNNLGLGATYENTLVVGDEGVINNELRWPDEFARHKALDLIGDLYLLGADLEAHVVALRSGHAANLELVQAILRHVEDRERTAKGDEPALRHDQIVRILPHRYPFLLVDRVTELEGYTRAVGIKNVSLNEPFFQGHYPGEPIMPGVLILEAMAQLAGLLLLRKLELTGKVPVLLSIDRVKFRRAVVPGDQIRLEAFTIRLSGGRGRVRCRSTVGGVRVAEARLNFALTESSSA